MVRRLIKRKPLHERTRKALTRAGLLVGGAAPFLMIVVSTVVYWSPVVQNQMKRSWESRVGANLGVRIRAGALKWMTFEQFRAEDVVAFHPETDVPLVKVRRLDGLMKPRGWSLILEDPVLDADQLEPALQLLHDGFLCKPQTRETMLALSVPNGFSLHRGGEQTRLGQIELVMKPTEAQSSLMAKFAFADQPFGEVQLQVVRSHDPENLSTSLEIQSPKSWIGISNFHSWLPVLRNFGEEAKFRGVLRAQWGGLDSDAMFQGQLDHLRMGDLTASFGSPLRGVGMASLERLNLRNGQILYAKGKLEVANGSANTAWLKRASQWLQLPSNWESQLQESQDIEAFAAGFEISHDGLRLQGLLPGPSQWPPVAIQLGQGTVCTPKEILPMTHLVAAVQSTSGSEVDLNAMQLASMLPWPGQEKSVGGGKPPSSRITRRWEDSKTR
jgi:hypothetical protein